LFLEGVEKRGTGAKPISPILILSRYSSFKTW